MTYDDWLKMVIRDIVSDTILSPQKAKLLWKKIQGGLSKPPFPKRYYLPQQKTEVEND